eukprot:Gregarina_sp_Pseudo_9__3770@NODE_391_length_2953_cov_31_549417_g368_i0_p1_GENE_NODE_391_length_2953_cov_31_549417_g368_i0NODE_391_length_2953_cov_31_549417_g368_i0_p1_ORF_typecomplete_len475_score134_67Glyco_transf_25/PF01755_17/4_2e09Chorismate_synt/PF01264_21/1_4e02Chorismate_synt/PF01264_21/1_6DUF1682/PF07946_14/4_4_NODE_391_length_2953_cov_31_549417_g368_i010962520
MVHLKSSDVLPQRLQRRRLGSTQFPLIFINLAESVERRHLLSFHFENATRLDAVSAATLVARGPQSLRDKETARRDKETAREDKEAAREDKETAKRDKETADNSAEAAALQYARAHGATVGAVSLTVSHCQALSQILETGFELGLVLEDDATAYLWGLSPFGNLDRLLSQLLLPGMRQETAKNKAVSLEVLFLQRIINPLQYPPVLQRTLLRDAVPSQSKPERRGVWGVWGPLRPALYSTEVGLGGTTAVAWNRPGMERFLALHRDGETAFGCPRDGSDCSLDFDLKSLGAGASLMPPTIGARISARSTIGRISALSQARDALRHLQGELTSIESAASLFELASLMCARQVAHPHTAHPHTAHPHTAHPHTAQVSVEKLALAWRRVADLPPRRLDWPPTGSWVAHPVSTTTHTHTWLEGWIRNTHRLVFASTFLIVYSVLALLLILRRLCTCDRKRYRKLHPLAVENEVEMKRD